MVEILDDPGRPPQFFIASFGSLSALLFRHQRSDSLSVTMGSMSFDVKMSPELSPALQVIAYVILPSENVIAHKVDFTVTKCFLNQVSGRTSPS